MCGKACGCRKAGLKCSAICLNCSGQSCDNVSQVDVVNDEVTDAEVDENEAEHEEENISSDENINAEETINHEGNIDEPGPSKRIKLYI